MPSSTMIVPARDGTPLLVRTWPPAGSPWLHVLIVHGLEDHSGRYRRVGDQYAANGIAAHAFDQRWSGGSGGRRGDVDQWDRLLDDLEDRLAATRESAGELPVALHAHSFGGLLAADYFFVGRPPPDLAVLSAPGLDDDLARWKHVVAPLAARVVPAFQIPNGIDPEALARDRSDPTIYGSDDLRHTSSSVRFGAFSFAAQARVTAAATTVETMAVPTLVIHGSADGIVPPRATEPFERIGGAERIVYPGLRHELHNEPEGPAVVADVVGWLRARVKERTPTSM